jgi:hypothetical protein
VGARGLTGSFLADDLAHKKIDSKGGQSRNQLFVEIRTVLSGRGALCVLVFLLINNAA